jgi:molybdopterin molybdotransferase
VCFELFVRPALLSLAGQSNLPKPVQATLAKKHCQRGGRATYWPAKLETAADGSRSVTPLPWKGSGDLRTLADANALAIFPAGDRTYVAGETVATIPLDGN